MSEIIPAYSPATEPQHKTSNCVDLAPVAIRPSTLLWQIELVFYCTFLIAASIALFPFFLSAFYWPILWLVFLMLVIFVLYKAWVTKSASPRSLSVQKSVWRLGDGIDDSRVFPSGDILLWSWVIVLPLRDPVTSRKYTLVALQDSMKEEDWRKLRVWLRTGIKNNI